MSVPERANPFPGLRAFGSDQSDLFFGRETQRSELLRRLKRGRFLALVGASGSGKSSLVRAGLIPALQGGLRTPFARSWKIAVMRPGKDPLRRLAEAMIEAGAFSDPGDTSEFATAFVEATLRRSTLGLVETVRQSEITDNVLVLVDQFEELFRLSELADDNLDGVPSDGTLESPGRAFVRLLLEAVQQSQVPVYVMLTMRSDYLGDCARYPGLPEAISTGQYLIPRLTREQMRRVIEGPARAQGGQFAPRLVHALLNGVGDDPDQLPILQHALMRTWEHWAAHEPQSAPIDVANYEAVGTMRDALNRHADDVYAALETPRRQVIAQKIFKCLTEIDADHRAIRRPSSLRELCDVTAAPPAEVAEVVDVFRNQGASFLLPGIRERLGPDSIIDITHESLIRVWGRLHDWVQEEAHAADEYRRLAERALLYQQGKDTHLSGPALSLALEWRERNSPNEAWAYRYHPEFRMALRFLDESLSERRLLEEREAKAARRELEQARALAEEQRGRFEEQRRAASRLRWFTLLLLVILLGAVGAAFYAHKQRGLADQSARRALAGAYAADAINRLDGQPRASLMQALRAVAVTYSTDGFTSSQALRALNLSLQGIQLNRRLQHGGEQSTRQVPVNAIAFSPDAHRVASAGSDGVLRVWEHISGRAIHHQLGATSPAVPLVSVEWSRDGKIIVVGRLDGTIVILSANDGVASAAPLTEMNHGARISSVALSPDATFAASGGWDGTIGLWNVETGQQLARLEAHSEPVTRIAFHPSGRWMVSAGWDCTVGVWDLDRGSMTDGKEPELLAVPVHSAAVTALAMDPHGDLLATGASDGSIKLWDFRELLNSPGVKADCARPAVTGRSLSENRHAITALAFGSQRAGDDGTRADRNKLLVSAGHTKELRLWEALSGIPLQTLSAARSRHGDWINALAFTPNGEHFASADDDGLVVVWNARMTRKSSRPLPGYGAWLADSGSGVPAASGDSQVRIDNSGTAVLTRLGAQETYNLTPPGFRVVSVAFNEEDSRVAILSDGNFVREHLLDVTVLVDAACPYLEMDLSLERCLALDLPPPVTSEAHTAVQ